MAFWRDLTLWGRSRRPPSAPPLLKNRWAAPQTSHSDSWERWRGRFGYPRINRGGHDPSISVNDPGIARMGSGGVLEMPRADPAGRGAPPGRSEFRPAQACPNFFDGVERRHHGRREPTLRGPGGALTGSFRARSFVWTHKVNQRALHRSHRCISAHAYCARVCPVASYVCSAVNTACASCTVVDSHRG